MRSYKGSATIEMAYIMPVFLLVFTAAVYMTFYYHDKNILQGTAYETAVIIAQKNRMEEEVDGEQCFRERLGKKLIFFSAPTVSCQETKDNIIVTARVKRRRMGIAIEQKAAVTQPEKYIRDIRKVKKIVQE